MFVLPALVDSAPEEQPAVRSGLSSLNRQVRRAVLLLTIIWPGWCLSAGPPTESTPAPEAARPAAPAEQAAAKTTKPPPTREQKRRVVAVTSIVIAGILTVLLLMLLWIVWWSRRTHRMLRAPLPAANRGDELWYLKAKRPPNPTANNPATDSPPAPPQA